MRIIFFILNNFILIGIFADQDSLSFIKTDTTTTISDRADVVPEFPGGPVGILKYIQKNLKYPTEAKNRGAEGKVLVKFYIDTDGAVKDPVILKDPVGFGASEEALRLIRNMPKWKPGTQKGKPVKVYYTMPVTFKLQ
jgi:protein TonB